MHPSPPPTRKSCSRVPISAPSHTYSPRYRNSLPVRWLIQSMKKAKRSATPFVAISWLHHALFPPSSCPSSFLLYITQNVDILEHRAAMCFEDSRAHSVPWSNPDHGDHSSVGCHPSLPGPLRKFGLRPRFRWRRPATVAIGGFTRIGRGVLLPSLPLSCFRCNWCSHHRWRLTHAHPLRNEHLHQNLFLHVCECFVRGTMRSRLMQQGHGRHKLILGKTIPVDVPLKLAL